MSRKMSDAMRARWSDPEWAAAQRKRISDGLKASPHVSGAQRERRRKEADGEVEPARRPWTPGEPKPIWLRRGT